MRIRTAIFLVYVAACAAGYLVLMWFMLAEVRPRYVNGLRHTLEGSARLLAATLADRPLPSAEALRATHPDLRLRVADATGRVLLDTAEPEAAPGEDGYTKLVARASRTLLDERGADSAAEVATSVALRLQEGTVATLSLSRPVRSVNAVIWSERRKLALVATVIAGVMVVAGWWIATRLTTSIERLTRYVQQVRDGRPAVPPVSRAAEIAALSEAFEQMREALEGRKHVERTTQLLAHEVKAPLAAIRGAAELLEEDMPPEDRQRFMSNIRGETQRIQQIVERLLELSSLEARKALAQTETVTFAELLNDAATAMRPAFEGAQVSLSVLGTEAGAVKGERTLLRAALVNLLQNALDFSPAGGEVTVVARAESGRCVIAVEDRGPGVPDYALPRVFERFYSLPRPGTTRKSTGLGLSLVREIAHQHAGEATLTNREGGGARAALSLPTV